MINGNIKNTNDSLDNISKEVADLEQSLEFTQDQMNDDISDIKKELKKIDKNIKEVEDDPLDPYYVSSKLRGSFRQK